MIEPSYLDPAVLSENLVIDRESGILRRNVPAVPTNQQETVMTIYGVLGFLRLLSGEHMIVITNRERIGQWVDNADVWRMTAYQILPMAPSRSQLTLQQREREDSLLASVQDVLDSDLLYFSYKADITRCVLQSHLSSLSRNSRQALWQRVDSRFFWNRFLQRKMIEQTVRDTESDLSGFILPVMNGFLEWRQCTINQHKFTFALISRRHIGRHGPRYFSRGIDADGNVSNFVETEQLLGHKDKWYSFVQIRGSIPLHWQQVVNVRYQPRLEVLNHPMTEMHIRKHFQEIERIYGDILCFNLVNAKGYELKVGDAMSRTVKSMNDSHVKYTHFDFHHECRGMQWHRIHNLFQQFEVDLRAQGYSVLDGSKNILLAKQTSVVRTNCMDCLDRTNVVQSELARSVLVRQLLVEHIITETQKLDEFREFDSIFKNVWADNADAISLQYSGTGALKTDFTRTGKRTKIGLLQDGINSVTRYVKNNFMDGKRQDALDLLLGRFTISPVHPLPAVSDPSSRFYLLPSALFFSFIMIVVSLIFITEWSTSLSYVVLWTIGIFVSWKMIISNGSEFVQLPILINPYIKMEPMLSPGRIVVNEDSKNAEKLK